MANERYRDNASDGTTLRSTSNRYLLVVPTTHKTTRAQFYLPILTRTLAFSAHAITTTIKRQEMCEQFLRHPSGLIPLSLSSLLIVVVDLPVSCRSRFPRRRKRYHQVRRWLLLRRRSTVARSLLRVPWSRLVRSYTIRNSRWRILL
jgi:hypothetical protein